MAATVTTHDLSPGHAERVIRVPGDGAGDGVEEGGPAAAALELVVCLVERRGAAGAGVDAAGGGVFVVFAREGRFGAFFAEDAELFCGWTGSANFVLFLRTWSHQGDGCGVKKKMLGVKGTTYQDSVEPAIHHRSSSKDKTCRSVARYQTKLPRTGSWA